MVSKTLSIGARGQITLPKKLRDLFKTNAVVLELVDNQHAIISPVPDVGGAIAEFNKETDLSFDEIRNSSWINSRNSLRVSCLDLVEVFVAPSNITGFCVLSSKSYKID